MLADGWKLKLVDPYGTPQLHVRRPGQEITGACGEWRPTLTSAEVTTYTSDDPFYTEVSSFIDIIGDSASDRAVLCSYDDAIATYELVRSSEEDPQLIPEDLGYPCGRRGVCHQAQRQTHVILFRQRRREASDVWATSEYRTIVHAYTIPPC